MFVRKKKNKSGTISVVIVDKSSGKYKELKTIGVSDNQEEVSALMAGKPKTESKFTLIAVLETLMIHE